MAPEKAPEPARGESQAAGLKVARMNIPNIIAQSKYAVERAVRTAHAMPGDRIVYAYVPAEHLVDALDIDKIDVKAHPSGVYLWVEYYPEDTRTPWRLGVYWIDERSSEDPEYFSWWDRCEMMWRLLDDVEYFTSEPKPLGRWIK